MIFMTLFLLIIAAIAIYYLFLDKDINGKKFFTSNEKRCSNCKNIVEESFNVCPICKETLKKKCENCGERVSPRWKYCPYCENLINK